MTNTKKTIIITLAVLLLSCAAVFANAEIEKAVVEKAGEKVEFSSLDLETASFGTIEQGYLNEVETYRSKYESIYDKMVESYNEGNVDDYFDAKGMLRNLQAPKITAEQTDILANRISQSKDDASAAEFAAWLYENSAYYRPVITLTRASEESGSSEKSSFRYSFRYTISREPGQTVKLPSVGTTFTQDGLFAGWGVTADEVTYQAGDEIQMPYTDLTLYAVYKAGVLFTDSVTGTEVFEDGSSIDAPSLTAPDESYVFAGWYGSDGKKAEGSVTLESGQSEIYQAGWKSVVIGNVYTGRGRDVSVTAGKDSRIEFSIRNRGNLNTGSITIDLVPENEDVLTVSSGTLSTDSLRPGQTKSGSFTVKASGNAGDEIAASIVVKDSDGNTWSTPVTITVK